MSTANLKSYNARWNQKENELRKASGGVYDLSKVKTKTAIFSGTEDRVTPLDGIQALALQADMDSMIIYENEDHFSFLLSNRQTDFYEDLERILIDYIEV